jgi:transposase
MNNRAPDRATDERLLGMIRARASGMPTTQIAVRFGVSQQWAANATNAVREADVAHPDPRAGKAEIRGAYW